MTDPLSDLIERTADALVGVLRGGPGSGHHGHRGRPGKVGGSLPDTGTAGPAREGRRTGRRITDVLRVPGTERWAGAREALEAIDSVHGIATTVPSVPVKITRSKYNAGQYRYSKWADGSTHPLDIGISMDEGRGRDQADVFIHEVGHLLDQQMLGRTGRFARHASENLDDHPGLDRWWEAVQASQAYEKLAKFHSGIHRVTLPETGTMYWTYDSARLRSQRTPHEFFARSYSQWIALRSGSPRLQQAVKQSLQYSRAGASPVQWEADDFGPIAKALDAVFEEAGWLND